MESLCSEVENSSTGNENDMNVRIEIEKVLEEAESPRTKEQFLHLSEREEVIVDALGL